MKFIYLSSIVTTITLLLVSTKSFAEVKTEKYNICAITINSDNEKILFQKNLGLMDKNGKPIQSKYFNFIELTDGAKKDSFGDHGAEVTDSENWFDKACQKLTQSNTSCDVVIFSGHFGGSFFGNSDLDLSLEDLEKHSCNNSCKGLLEDPTEVFLFGCNTLAGKNKDRRSPEEYRRVLVDDGFTREQAERIASSRYGDVGRSFRARMKMVFSADSKNATHLYGFDSIAPSGRNIEGALKDYFWKKFKNRPLNYYNHLQKEKIKRLNIFLSSAQKKTSNQKIKLKKNLKPNNVYTKAMKGKGRWIHEHQCYGNVLDLDDKERELKNALCTFYKTNVQNLVKLKKTYDLMATGNFVSYIPLIQNYISSLEEQELTPQEEATLTKIKGLNSPKKTLLKIINNKKIHMPQIKISIATLMNQLDWLSKEEVNSKIKSIIKDDLLSLPLKIEKMDSLCTLYRNSLAEKESYDEFPKFDFNEIPKKLIKTAPFNYGVTCLKYSNPKKMADYLLKTGKSDDNLILAHKIMTSPHSKNKSDILNFYKKFIKKRQFVKNNTYDKRKIKLNCKYMDCKETSFYIDEIFGKLKHLEIPFENHPEFLKLSSDWIIHYENNFGYENKKPQTSKFANQNAKNTVNYIAEKKFNSLNYFENKKRLRNTIEYFILYFEGDYDHLRKLNSDKERLNYIILDIVNQSKKTTADRHDTANAKWEFLHPYSYEGNIMPILYKPLMEHLVKNPDDVSLFNAVVKTHKILPSNGVYKDYFITNFTKIKQKSKSIEVIKIIEDAINLSLLSIQ